jgi:hypothetical protein
VQAAQLGSPYTPSILVFAAGALGGLALLALSRAVPRVPRVPAWAVAIVIGLLAVPVGNGYIERSVDVVGTTAPATGILKWFTDQPGFGDDDWKIAVAARGVPATLAGDHFTHELELIPPDGSCAAMRRIPDERPLFVSSDHWWVGLIGVNEFNGPDCMQGERAAYTWFDLNVYRR